jgi:hypothetical protein
MELVDAQIHEPHAAAHWEFGDESELALNVELAREAMDCVGVDAGLINARAEFCDAAFAAYPDRFASCLFADLNAEDMDGYISTFRDTPGRLALRVVIRRHTDGQLTPDYLAGKHEPVFDAAEKHEVPVFMQAAGHMDEASKIAEAHPGLNLIVDHLGLNQQPAEVGPEPWAALDSVNALARFPNVTVKFCGGPTLTSSPYPYDEIWPYLMRMVEAFTPDRLMWGSDYTRLRIASAGGTAPRDEWYGTYAEHLFFILETDKLSDSDKEKLLGQTLRRVVGWPAGA